MLGPRAFDRRCDGTDERFFSNGESRPDLSAAEREVVHHLIRSLVVEREPAVLDLFTGAETLVPESVGARRIVALGPSRASLERNRRATERVVHDVNRPGPLPFDDATFDVVLSTFSVPYLLEADRTFDEVGRVLKPGGLFLVVWNDRYHPEHAIRYWRAADADERSLLVEDCIGQSRHFEHSHIFEHPAPHRDGHDGPVYVVYAEKRGERGDRPERPVPSVLVERRFSPAEVEVRKQHVAETLECPYCGERLREVSVAPTPWGGWDVESLFICMNDECPYRLESFGVLSGQGIRSYNYRATFHPGSGQLLSLPSPLEGDKVLPRRLNKDH